MFRQNTLILTIFTGILLFIYYRIHWTAHERTLSRPIAENRVTRKTLDWVYPVKDLEEMDQEEPHPLIKPTQSLIRPEYLLEAHECMKEQFAEKTDRNVWEDFSQVVMNCTPYDAMRIKIHANSQRYHYFQKPARYEDNQFLENYPACRFLGIDPIDEGRQTAYNQVGKFVKALITADGKPREIITVQGNLTTKTSQSTIEIGKFFKENLDNKIVDVLWMDAEYEEYDLFPLFLKNSTLFQNGYRICQIQVEIHGHLEKTEIISKYAKFVREMFDEGRYLPIHSMQSVHIRAFLFNFGDDECFHRYIETFDFFSDEFYPINY